MFFYQSKKQNNPILQHPRCSLWQQPSEEILPAGLLCFTGFIVKCKGGRVVTEVFWQVEITSSSNWTEVQQVERSLWPRRPWCDLNSVASWKLTCSSIQKFFLRASHGGWPCFRVIIKTLKRRLRAALGIAGCSLIASPGKKKKKKATIAPLPSAPKLDDCNYHGGKLVCIAGSAR